jgi:hypothetical protein
VEVKQTALQNWISKREPQFEPKWLHLSTRSRSVLITTFGCSPAPTVYHLRPILSLIVERLDERKIAKLVEVLRTGTKEEQREFSKVIEDEIFKMIDVSE